MGGSGCYVGRPVVRRRPDFRCRPVVVCRRLLCLRRRRHRQVVPSVVGRWNHRVHRLSKTVGSQHESAPLRRQLVLMSVGLSRLE